MGGVKRKPKAGTGTTVDALALTASAVHVDHARNYSRAQIHPCPAELEPFFGKGSKICFTLAEIEARLAAFKATTQISPVQVYLTLTGDAYLVAGYLRHAAFLLAEVRGETHLINTPGHRLRCTTVTEPKSQADWLALADLNVSENDDAKPRTPVDIAYSFARYLQPEVDGGFGLTIDQLCEKTGLKTRTIYHYMRLLKLPPDVIGKVHRGELKHSAALKASTATGQADSPGPRPSFSVKRIRKAVEMREINPPPDHVLTSDEQVMLASMIAGEVFDADTIPEGVKAWADWMQPEPAPREPKQPKQPKKAPPKAGEKVVPS